jgi:hypothetical protein
MKLTRSSGLTLLTASLVVMGGMVGAGPAQAARISPHAGSPLDPTLAAVQALVVGLETQVSNLLTTAECLLNTQAPPTCGAPL